MTDVTSTCVLEHSAHPAGINVAIISNPSASAADTIELNTLLESEGLGERVKEILYCACTEDFDGTPVTIPMKWTTTDTLTIGTGPSTAEVTILVFYK